MKGLKGNKKKIDIYSRVAKLLDLMDIYRLNIVAINPRGTLEKINQIKTVTITLIVTVAKNGDKR